jgi:hypothetical protein
MTVAGHIEHSFMCCLAKERERSDSSISSPVPNQLSLFTSKRSSRRPRSPSCNHNVKELVFWRELPFCQKRNTASKLGPQAAWARCIGGGISPVNRKSHGIYGIFPGAVDSSPAPFQPHLPEQRPELLQTLQLDGAPHPNHKGCHSRA